MINYRCLLAKDLFALTDNTGDVFLLSTGEETGWTTEKKAGDFLNDGEVCTIPWGKSRPLKDVIKYYNGKFVTADNRIATSNNKNLLLTKFLYYYFMSKSVLIDSFYRGSGIKHPDMNQVLNMFISLPPLKEQQRIMSILDKFEKYCNDIEEGLPKLIELSQKRYEYYRDKLLNFKRINN